MVAQFNSDLEVCNCDSGNIYDKSCDAISFNDVSDVVLKGINVTVRTPSISGIVFWKVSNMTVQFTTLYSLSSNTCSFGIRVIQAETVRVNVVGVYHFKTGFALKGASNVWITNTTTQYSNQNGIFLENINDTQISNTRTTDNVGMGIILRGANYTFLKRTTAMYNGMGGIYLYGIAECIINITITMHNHVGMYLLEASGTYIIETTATYNNEDGIVMQRMNKTLILNITLSNNGFTGLISEVLNNTQIISATAMHNGLNGIELSRSINTLIFDTTCLNNTHGIVMQYMNISKIINAITRQNSKDGIILVELTDTILTNVTAINNRKNGIDLEDMTTTKLTGITVIKNHLVGITMHNMSSTWLTNTTFISNKDRGVHLEDMNHTYIANVIATHNSGSGIVLTKANNNCIANVTLMYNDYEGMMLFTTNNSSITNINSSYNTGNGLSVYISRNTIVTNAIIQHNLGSAMLLEKYSLKFGYFFQLNAQITAWSSIETVIQKSSFVEIDLPSTASTTNPSTLPAIIALYQSTLEIIECSFKQNHISTVRAHESNITLSGNVVFSNNTAVSGTAFILVQGSIISLAKNSNVKFRNNYATNAGGVFYIDANDYVHIGDTSSNRKCFLNTPVDRSQIQFTFVNNSAGMGGDILYGGQVAFAVDGDWNCLESFKNISTITYYKNDYSLLSSDPSRVCFCNETKIPDCTIFSNTFSYSFYPGQNMYISAVIVGQDFGTVAGSVYAQYLKRSPTDNLLELNISQKVQSVTQNSCNKLSYTLFSPNSITELILVLTVDETIVSSPSYQIFPNRTKLLFQQFYHTSKIQPLLYSNIPIYITISVLPCPLGFLLKSDPPFKCDCNQLLQQIPGVYCDIQTQTFGRSGMVWVGMTHGDNGSNGTVVASQYCPLNYCNKKGGNVTLANPDSQCNYNHSGILCGACQPGLTLALGSERCLPCSNKYLALLIPFTLAGPILVGCIKLLDLTVSQGTMNGMIFYANVIQANHYIFLPWRSNNILSLFIAWLNLDLGVETCFFEGLDAYYKTWLQFVFPLYIWSIVGLIIILSKYSRRVAKVMGNNSVPVLATLFLLSYAKLFSIIISALSYTILYTSEGHKVVWSADGNVDYLNPRHMVLFIVAVASLLFLWLPYTLFLFLGQWLHMCNCQLIARFLFKMKPFLDAHYAPMKDKHRYWFGALHLVRAAILLVSALIPADHSSIVTISILVSVAVLMYFGSIVYQKPVVAMFNMGFFLNLIIISGATFYTQIIGADSRVYAYPLTGLVFIQFIGLVTFKVYSIFKKSSKFIACFRMCWRPSIDDDWELFEQATLLRERESEFEKEGSEDSGSMESLPTY